LERLRDDTGVVARDVEGITHRKRRIEAAPAVKALAAHEQHAGARGFVAGATDERIEDLAERSSAAEDADPFGDPPGGSVALGGRPLGAIDGRSIGFGASHCRLLGFRAGGVCFGANGVDFGAGAVDFGASAVDFGASRVGLGAGGVGFGAGDGREFVADDANLPGDFVANLPRDLVAETVGKCIQSALELFVKGQR
jgi:hypothetical protein